jgi:DNA-binding transcriptional LysR family regulator
MSETETDSYRHPWLGVEVRHLATLDAIARGGSFREAADRLGYVQSAVSQQMAALEQVVGTRLLERGPGRGPVSLTAAGNLVVDHGRRILTELEAARTDLTSVACAAPATLAIGLAPGIATRLLPRLLPALRDRLPQARLRFTETANEDDLLEQVRTGGLDAAVGVAPADDRFASARLLGDPWALLAPADSLLAHRGRLSLGAQLEGQAFLIPADSRAFAPVAAQLEAAGLLLASAIRAPIGPAMQAAVASARAVALMPRMAIDETDPATAVVALDPPIAPRLLSLVWNRCRRELALVDHLHTVLLELAGDSAFAGASASVA